MPSRCTCVNGWDADCKRHGAEARAKARAHKRSQWADPEAATILAERQRTYRAETGANLRVNRGPAERRAASRARDAEPLRTHWGDNGHAQRKLERMADRPEDWKAQAACRPGTGVDPSIFYVERGDNTGALRAKAICARCPVWQECAAYAFAANEKHGIWGGMGEHERRRWARDHREAMTA